MQSEKSSQYQAQYRNAYHLQLLQRVQSSAFIRVLYRLNLEIGTPYINLPLVQLSPGCKLGKI
jgi:hypothetical protein